MKKANPFFQAHLVFLILCAPLVFLPKGSFELWLNELHTPWLDVFFRYITYLGDGVTSALLVVILLTFNYYKTIVYTTAILFDTFVIQVLGKRLFFPHLVRPKNFYGEEIVLNFVEGVKTHGHHTFPSGHTGSAFVWLGFLALILPRKYGLVLFFIALMAGVSRVYIQQHFFIDIYVGSIIGTASVLLSQYFFGNFTNLHLNNKLQRGLFFK